MRFVDPRGRTGITDAPYTLRLQPGPAVVALLSNRYRDASEFLTDVGAALTAMAPELRVRLYEKPGPAGQVAPELLETIVAEANAVVAAYGH
jgi:hypothetical protein